MKKWQKVVLIAPLAVLGMALFIALGGWIVESLWNWLVPGLFGLPAVTFWQALGLLLLCRILFGGWSGRGGGGSRWRSRMRRRMDERCAGMTPEERERFRQRMREKWGYDPGAADQPAAD